jgi:hypothetical protein
MLRGLIRAFTMLVLVLSGCSDDPPASGATLGFDGYGSLRFGMDVQEASRILGAPVQMQLADGGNACQQYRAAGN